MLLSKMKQVFVFVLVLCLWAASPVWAATSLDFLKTNPLYDEKVIDYQTAAMTANILELSGRDITFLKYQINRIVPKDLASRIYYIMATKNTSVGTEIAAGQNSNGSWNNDVGLTALVCLSLLKVDTTSATAANGINFIQSSQNQDGGWGSNGSEVITTAMVLKVFKALGIYNSGVQKGLAWLLSSQGSDGGWGSNISTAWACVALEEYDINNAQLKEAIKYLRLNINNDGGWGIYQGEASNLYVSALVVWALRGYNWTLWEVSIGLYYLEKEAYQQKYINSPLAYNSTSETLHLLKDIPEYSSIYSHYWGWLRKFPEQANTEHISRKASLLAGNGEDTTILVNRLIKNQNPDGGWGFGQGYSSDPLDTALALRALLDGGYADFAGYQKIVAYFNSQQNSDGSFSIKKSGDGQVYLTALIVEELARLNKILNCSFIINSSRQWLMNQRNGSGGYGDGILETARALRVIIDDLYSSDLESALSYINESKLPNGSWNDDALTTAAVLSVLNRVKPNLAVSAADLVFTPEITQLQETVTVNVTVHNTGVLKAENVIVRLYQGEEPNRTLVGAQTIPEVLPKQTNIISISWTTAITGPVTFTAILDPENQIAESNENDNQASKILKSVSRIDLEITSENVIVTPVDPEPTDQLDIKAIVRNNGYLTSGAFNVAFYNGNPQLGGILLGTKSCDGLAGQEILDLSFKTQLTLGDYQIYVIIDPENQVQEASEDNNQALSEIKVQKRIDLAITYGNVFFSKPDPIESEQIKVFAVISNFKGETTYNVPVNFYLADSLETPNKGGTLLGTVTLDKIEGNSSQTVEISWDTTGISNTAAIRAVVDPENTITEVNEYNNSTFAFITIDPRSDLTGSFTISSDVEGNPAYIYLYLENQYKLAENILVRFYLGDPNLNNKIWEDVIHPNLYPGNRWPIPLGLDTSKIYGELTVYAQIDPENTINESNENNNLISQSFTINPAPDISIVTSDVSISPAAISDGDLVTINAIVKNLNNTRANNVMVGLYHEVNGEWIFISGNKSTYEGNQQKTISFTWNSDGNTGINHFKIIADPEETIYERDKINNTVLIDINVNPALMPELTFEPESLNASEYITREQVAALKAKIINLRSADAENVKVGFYNGVRNNGGVLINEQIVSIPGKGSVFVEAPWETTNLKYVAEVYAWIDPDGLIEEYNKNNNSISKTFAIKANRDYQPQNTQATVNYHDVDLSWDNVTVPNVIGYLVYRDNQLINRQIESEHGSVCASSQSGINVATRAIDDNLDTYWFSQYNNIPCWFEEEFSEYKYIEEIEINWFSSYYGVDYQIQVWNGEQYITIVNVAGNKIKKSIHKFDKSGIPVKRYRILVNKAMYYYVGISEINIKTREIITSNSYNDLNLTTGTYNYTVTSINNFGEESLPSKSTIVAIEPPPSPQNVNAQVIGPDVELSWEPSIIDCQGYYLKRDGNFLGGGEKVTGGIATAAGYNYPPSNAIDGNSNTYWSYVTSEKDIWWQLDLPIKKYITSMNIEWYSYPSDYQICLWHNGGWLKIAEIKGNKLSTTEHTFDEKYKTDKIRINIIKTSESDQVSVYAIKELTIFAQKRLIDTKYHDPLLKSGTYQYSLTADNSVSCESYPANIEVNIEPPVKPTNLTAEVVNNDINLSWRHEQEAIVKGYLVYRNGTMIATDQIIDITSQAKVNASSSYYSNQMLPDQAVDGNLNTFWYSNNVFPVWYSIKFDEYKLLSGIKINWFSNGIGKNYLFQYKNNGFWSGILNIQDNNLIEAVHNFPQLIYTDEIRIYITEGINSNIIINELYVYENQLLATNSYSDLNMSTGSYEYQVRAIDRAGNWGYLSDIVQAKVGSYPSPENLSANVTNNQVSLEWTISDTKNVNGFYVYRDNRLITRNLSKEYSVVVSSNDNYSQYLTDGNDSTYWYGYDDSFIELSSLNNNDIDKIVLQWFAVPTKNYKILAWINDSWQTIREINNNTNLVNEILLEKPLTTNKLRIEITYEDRTISLGEIVIYDSLISCSNFTETVLETGYHLYYVQAAFTDGELSSFSNQVNVHIDDSVSPVTPTNFIVTEEENSLKLEWSPNQETDLAGYYLYFGETKLQINDKILNKNTTTYSYRPIGFTDCKFELVAIDINGNRSLPAVAEFSFDRPLPPTDVKANVYKDRLSISFKPTSKNIMGYKLYKDGVPINFVNINPSEVKASSIYYGSNRYYPGSVIDSYTNTFWKPHPDDKTPWIEFNYTYAQFISAIEINWLSSNEVPDDYVIEAWINQEWESIGVGSKKQKQLFDLQDAIFTDKLRIRINEFYNSPCLAEVTFNYFCRSFNEINLLPGLYRYQVTAINAAGLQSPKSEEAQVIISEQDLEVIFDEVFTYPLKPHFQSPTVIRANIKNIGTQISRNIKVRFYLDSQETILYETLIDYIEPGKDALVEAELNLTQTGSHTLIIKVDPENKIIEYNENNNEVVKALEISDQKVIETRIRHIDATNFPEVLVDLAINDEFGQTLTNLTVNSFTVMEDNIKQKLNSVKYLPNDPTIKPKVDIIFVLDVTMSMGDDYEMVYDSIYTFLNLLEKQNIDYNLGLTLFGDGVYIQQNGQLTNSGDTFRYWMENPTGGDWGFEFPENSVGALLESISKMAFRHGTKKAFILVTDAPSWNTEIVETIQQIKEINGSIYVVGPTTDNLRDIYDGYCPSDWENQYMGEGSLSVETGGKFYPITKGFSSLIYDLANEITQKVFNYQITYNTLNYIKDGSERIVDLKLNYGEMYGEDTGKYTAPLEIKGDIAIKEILVDPTYPNETDNFKMVVNVKNDGTTTIINNHLRIYLGNPNTNGYFLDEKVIERLESGQSLSFEFNQKARPGVNNYFAYVDPENLLNEANEDNNLSFITTSVPGMDKPDLTFTEINVTNGSPLFRGDNLYVSCKLVNLGVSSSNIKVYCYENTPYNGGSLIARQTVESVDYLAAVTVEFIIPTHNLAQKSDLYFVIDPFNQIDEFDEANNVTQKTIDVNPRMIIGTITSNKLEYSPNETASFSLLLENKQEADWLGSVEVVIKDEGQNLITNLGNFSGISIGAKSTNNNIWNNVVLWNIGKCQPGSYSAQLNLIDDKLSEGNNIIASFITKVRVLSDKGVTATLFTDKSVYAPQDKVIIYVDSTNASVNTNLENVIQNIMIKDQSGTIIWSEETTIPYLPVSGSIANTFYWTINNIQSGEYQIIIEMKSDSKLLWSGSKAVTVDDKAILTGTLNVNPRYAKTGQAVVMDYTIYNRGNLGLNDIPVNILFINDSTQVITKTVTHTHNFDLGGFVTKDVQMTVDLPDAQYMVVLQTEVNGEIIGLSSAALLVDSTPPVTVAELSNHRLNKDGILFGVLDSKLILTAADNFSGVAETVIDLGNGYQSYNEPVSFPAEGKYIIRFKSLDRLNNEENVNELTVIIDETPPVATIISPIDNQEVASEFTINLTASDNVGLDHYELYVNGEKYADYIEAPVEQDLQLEPGEYLLKARAVDLSGYESWSTPVKIKVMEPDVTPPVTVADYPMDWTNQDVTVTLTATDDLRGVKETCYRVDDGVWQVGTTLQINTEGIHTVAFYSIDNVNNVESPKSITVKIDKTKPISKIVLTGDQRPDGAYLSKVTITLTALDNSNGSGMKQIYYRLGAEGSYQPYTEPLVITTEGLNEFYVCAMDNAGNTETPQRVEFKIAKIWQPDYSLICNRLTIHGNLNVDRVFVNGSVNIYGHCHLNYLGSTEKTILKTGPSTIDTLMTGQSQQPIPKPDWEGLKAVTALRKEKQIPKNVILNNVRFENSLMIAGTTKLSGLIVIKGDLIINGNVDLNKAGIFCSGKITFNGNVKGSGLIYGAGLTAHGNPQLNGAIIINGPVEASGTIGNQGVNLREFLKWFD